MKTVLAIVLGSFFMSGCLVGSGPSTVYYPSKKTTVIKKNPSDTTVVVEENLAPAVVVYEEATPTEVVVYYTEEPYYDDYCELYDGGWEECCYDYDWNIVWLNSHEYIYEVCEYTSCVDYWYGDAWMQDIVCWYE